MSLIQWATSLSRSDSDGTTPPSFLDAIEEKKAQQSGQPRSAYDLPASVRHSRSPEEEVGVQNMIEKLKSQRDMTDFSSPSSYTTATTATPFPPPAPKNKKWLKNDSDFMPSASASSSSFPMLNNNDNTTTIQKGDDTDTTNRNRKEEDVRPYWVDNRGPPISSSSSSSSSSPPLLSVEEPFTTRSNLGARALPNPSSTPFLSTQPSSLPTNGGDRELMMRKVNYMIQLLENQADSKTDHVFEEVLLYSMLGVFMIFITDSFVHIGKYVR